MKSTILSEKDIRLIEKAILKYGRILSINDLMDIFQEEYSRESAHNRINLLSKEGWFRRLKRGMYLIVDSLTSRSQIDVSLLSVANLLVKDSYVSCSHALNHYQFFDQYTNNIVSISSTVSKKYTLDSFNLIYSKVKKNLYFGFVDKIVDGKSVRLAEAEKALLDYLYLDNSFGSASLVFEKLKEHHLEIDLKKLQEYAVRCGLTIARKIGFLLDQLKLDSTFIHRFTEKQRGVSRFTTDSKIFNAKWRLYYDDRIIG